MVRDRLLPEEVYRADLDQIQKGLGQAVLIPQKEGPDINEQIGNLDRIGDMVWAGNIPPETGQAWAQKGAPGMAGAVTFKRKPDDPAEAIINRLRIQDYVKQGGEMVRDRLLPEDVYRADLDQIQKGLGQSAVIPTKEFDPSEEMLFIDRLAQRVADGEIDPNEATAMVKRGAPTLGGGIIFKKKEEPPDIGKEMDNLAKIGQMVEDNNIEPEEGNAMAQRVAPHIAGQVKFTKKQAKKPATTPFSPTTANTLKARLAEGMETLPQRGPGTKGFWKGFKGKDYAQQDLLAVYRTKAEMMGYQAMNPVQQKQFDAEWDAIMAANKEYEWDPKSADVVAEREDLRRQTEIALVEAGPEAAGGISMQGMTDQQAEALFEQLPAGTAFIDPEGTLRRK